MAISIDWGTSVIYVPRADMTLVQSAPTEIRELDINAFRLALKALEAGAPGMPFLKTHVHNTEVTLGGLTFARVVEILDPYTVTFEDGQYAVNLVGANSNIGDKVNVNQVSVRSQNSAGLISTPLIEFASFEGGIWVDETNGVAGTVFPKGTKLSPVSNFVDGKLIADYRGLNVYYVVGTATITPSLDFSKNVFEGQTNVNNAVVVNSIADVTNAVFRDLSVSGILDGGNEIVRCIVTDIEYVNGQIRDSGLAGTVTLGGNAPAFVSNCSQTSDVIPTFDMGGSGQDLVMPNYSGVVKIANLSGSNYVAVGLNSGKVVLDSTSVTGGIITVGGTGELVDENGVPITTGTWNGGVTVFNKAISNTTISYAVWDEPIVEHIIPDTMGYEMLIGAYKGVVHVHEGGGSGQLYPWGTGSNPVGNFADAIVIANLYKLNILHLDGDLVASGGVDLSGFTIVSDRSHLNSLTVADAITDPTYITDLTVSGIMAGGVRYTTCVLGAIDEFDGGAKNCLITNTIDVVGEGANYFTDCDVYTVDYTVYKEISVNDKLVNMIRCEGYYRIANKIGVSAMIVNMVGGSVEVDSSCVAGFVVIDGIADVVDNSGVGCTVINHAQSVLSIVTAVWAAVVDDNDTVGTFGSAVKDLTLDVDVIRQIEAGRWRIADDQMVFYADDGITPILTFDLKDQDGNPSMENVFERIRVT